jgi:hypothetical protein
MIKLNIDKNIKYTLVGAGCSHTQGCAFTIFNDNKVKWATKALENKYNTLCTPDFITNNLTWMAKLSKYISLDKIINLGLGGYGTTTSIRHIKEYIKTKSDISDHIFIIQLQSVYRNEIINKIFDPFTTIDSVNHFLNREEIDVKFRQTYADLLFEERVQEAVYFKELLFLQNIITKLGGQVRIFFQPWYNFPTFNKKERDNIDGAFYSVDKKSFYINEHKIKKTIKNLNIISLESKNKEYSIGELLGKNIRPTLHNEDLVPDDHHLSELGNSLVAKSIFYNINNKFEAYDEETPI